MNGFIEYDNRKEERCMRKMRTLFLVLLCCGLSLYAGVSYVKAEEKAEVKVCKACGKQLEEGVVFCTNCGTKIEDDKATEEN